MTMTADKPHSNPLAAQAGPASEDAQSLKAFEAAFLEHWSRVYSFLLRLVGDHAEAEDLALETFLRLYQRPPSAGGAQNLGGWLHRVASNLGLNALRSWKRRGEYEAAAGLAEIFEKSLAGPGAEPAEIFAAQEERRHARQVLGEMAPRQAQILLLRHAGLSYKEVAEAAGLAPASIGPLLARAEAEFERRYRARFGPPGAEPETIQSKEAR